MIATIEQYSELEQEVIEIKESIRLLIGTSLECAVYLALVMALFPKFFPFGFHDLLYTTGSVTDWMITAWPIFVFFALMQLAYIVKRLFPNKVDLITVVVYPVVEFLVRNDFLSSSFVRLNEEVTMTLNVDPLAGIRMRRGFWSSLRAGVIEEIFYRWFWFIMLIPIVRVVNWLLGGFSGMGVPEWLYNQLFGPLVDVMTLHTMTDKMANPHLWYVGLAVLISNLVFGARHAYQGWDGPIRSFIFGLMAFFLLFQYGLMAAILVHFLCDLLVHTLRYAASESQRCYAASKGLYLVS